jgi:hypothetical protein
VRRDAALNGGRRQSRIRRQAGSYSASSSFNSGTSKSVGCRTERNEGNDVMRDGRPRNNAERDYRDWTAASLQTN